jgi:hypothetical protein
MRFYTTQRKKEEDRDHNDSYKRFMMYCPNVGRMTWDLLVICILGEEVKLENDWIGLLQICSGQICFPSRL